MLSEDGFMKPPSEKTSFFKIQNKILDVDNNVFYGPVKSQLEIVYISAHQQPPPLTLGLPLLLASIGWLLGQCFFHVTLKWLGCAAVGCFD
jgi:hypothetical protein